MCGRSVDQHTAWKSSRFIPAKFKYVALNVVHGNEAAVLCGKSNLATTVCHTRQPHINQSTAEPSSGSGWRACLPSLLHHTFESKSALFVAGPSMLVSSCSAHVPIEVVVVVVVVPEVNVMDLSSWSSFARSICLRASCTSGWSGPYSCSIWNAAD